MKQLHTQIEIYVSDKRVWELLTDFASYPQWNPFIRHISGRPSTPGASRGTGHDLQAQGLKS